MEYFIALVGGILTFLSPCILPLIPVYLAYITGLSVKELKDNQNGINISINSIFFVFGFTLVFSIFSVLLFILSLGLSGFKIWFSRIGGLIVILFGLHLTGILKLNFLNFQLKAEIKPKTSGILSSFLLGVAFGGGWTPCVGPILSGILMMSTQSDKIIKAIVQLILYSLGIGIPFILTGVFLNKMITLFNFFKKHSKIIEIISGIFLIILGILIITGWINLLSSYFSKHLFFLNNIEENLIK